MSFRRRSLIFHQDIVTDFTLVDVGASGKLVEPWASLEAVGMLKVIGFEPEADACSKLSGHEYLPCALWDSPAEIPLHVGKHVSTSSVHPPNWALLTEYVPRHSAGRETAAVVSVRADTLDTALAGRDVDFIKIDTQGAEYEILRGGHDALSSAIGCTLETWTVEVHKGQALVGQIMEIMAATEHRLFDVERSAVWQRKGGFRRNRGELVGMDLLYLNPESPKLLKAALVADLWGYRALAAEMLARAGTVESRELLARLRRLDGRPGLRPQGRVGQLIDMVLPRLLPIQPSLPRIH